MRQMSTVRCKINNQIKNIKLKKDSTGNSYKEFESQEGINLVSM